MKNRLIAAIAVIVSTTGLAKAEPVDISVWAWGVAASSLESTLEGFNAVHPDITVNIEQLGYAQVKSRVLAACAAGGTGLPDVFQFQNIEMELITAQFPDCATDLAELGFSNEDSEKFPAFKMAALKSGDKIHGMPWDTGPVMMFYRRDMYDKADVDPDTIRTWDDFVDAGKKIQAANEGVVMTNDNLNGGAEWFRMIANEQGCGYFSNDGETITINQPGCVAALEVLKTVSDEGLLTAGDFGERLQNAAANAVATQMNGAWLEGSLRTNVPEDQSGLWGMYFMPSVAEGGPRAANVGGSLLAIASSSDNKEAAYEFVSYALGTNEGQVTMLREYGLVPSLLSALDDPYVGEAREFWGGQKIWQDVLSSLDRIVPAVGTPFFGDADQVMQATQIAYLNGKFGTAKEALDDAAQQISFSTGLPIAE